MIQSRIVFPVHSEFKQLLAETSSDKARLDDLKQKTKDKPAKYCFLKLPKPIAKFGYRTRA